MMEEIDTDYDIKKGLKKLWRWRFWIFGAVLVSGVLSIIFSLKLQDEFKSTVAFIPPSYSSLGTMTFGNGIAYRGFYPAEEEDIDRTIDYLTSTQVVDSIAKRFDLYSHYGIDMSKDNRDKSFYVIFFGKNEVEISENSTVVINCWDVDPEMAYKIAKYYLQLTKDYFEEVSHRKLGIEVTEQAISNIEEERKMIMDSLASLRSKYGIYLIKNLGEDVSKVLAQKMKNPSFHEYYDEVNAMELYLYTLELRYGDLQRELLARKLNFEQFPSLIWVTSEPVMTSFKERPKRSLIVVMAIFATFVLACFLAVVLDRKKEGSD